MRPTLVLWVGAVAMVAGWPSAAFGQPGGAPPDYDFDWVTIGAVGNAPYSGADPMGYVAGRGSVPYAYRMSRLEVTTSQWMEFVNAFAGTAGPRPHFAEYVPGFWGASPDPTYAGPGERWRLNPSLPTAAASPVYGITWRDAAQYANWLNNGKAQTLSALATGAYDTATWGMEPGGVFTDAPTHLPGASFWIPTFDEWLKSAHFDPNRYGPGQGGWWRFPNSSDNALLPGRPGEGQTTAGLPSTDYSIYDIPLGAYPDAVSPWGLLDLSGGASEWTEEYWAGNRDRILDGSPAGSFWPYVDDIGFFATSTPTSSFFSGIRLASAVPAPGTMAAPAWLALWAVAGRKRRRECCRPYARFSPSS